MQVTLNRTKTNIAYGETYWAKQAKVVTFGAGWRIERLKTYGTLQPDLFTPRAITERERRFVVIGDAGTGGKGQRKVADQMWELYQKQPFGSVLVLGDNVYEYGEPKYFDERIYDPYKKLFKAGVRFYPILGNHDVKGGYGDKQLAFWGAPAYYNFKLGNGDVEFFALDTTTMLPGFEGCYKKNTDAAKKSAEIQLQWLDKALGESTAKTKVVYGHYPLYSSGFHGLWEKYFMKRSNRFKMRELLEPLLEKHKVSLYLAGHDHHYERTEPIKGVVHVVSGSAGKLYNFVSPWRLYEAKQEACAWKRHFMLFDIKQDGSLQFDVIGKKGQMLDTGVIPVKPQPPQALALAPPAEHRLSVTG